MLYYLLRARTRFSLSMLFYLDTFTKTLLFYIIAKKKNKPGGAREREAIF
jgi:hypothetical protein